MALGRRNNVDILTNLTSMKQQIMRNLALGLPQFPRKSGRRRYPRGLSLAKGTKAFGGIRASR